MIGDRGDADVVGLFSAMFDRMEMGLMSGTVVGGIGLGTAMLTDAPMEMEGLGRTTFGMFDSTLLRRFPRLAAVKALVGRVESEGGEGGEADGIWDA